MAKDTQGVGERVNSARKSAPGPFNSLRSAHQGVMAITRSGLPDPPTIFSGAAMTMAPVAGT